jgi:hypothetical protein
MCFAAASSSEVSAFPQGELFVMPESRVKHKREVGPAKDWGPTLSFQFADQL